MPEDMTKPIVVVYSICRHQNGHYSGTRQENFAFGADDIKFFNRMLFFDMQKRGYAASLSLDDTLSDEDKKALSYLCNKHNISLKRARS